MADDSKPKTEGTSYICDLPTELLHEVISHLDNASLLQLGLTSRRLNYISLKTFFEKSDIQSPSNGWLVAYQTPPETLHALRAALWVKEIKHFHFYFNPGVDELVAEVLDMYWLIKRLSSIKVVRLHFSVVDTWLGRYRVAIPSSQRLDRRRWFEAFTRLLEIIIERGCVDLQITGAGMLESVYEELESFAPRPLPQLPAHAPYLTTPQAQASGSLGEQRGLNTSSVSTSQDLQQGVSHPTSTSKKKDKKRWPLKLRSTALFDLISRKHRASTKTHHMADWSNVTDLLHAIEIEKRSSDIQFPQPCTPRLTQVSIASEMLLQPLFFHWTVHTLTSNSFSITKLSVKCTNLTTQTWSTFLLSLTLPRLEDLEITTDLGISTTRAAFTDLRNFFARHPSINTLYLQGVDRLQTPPTIDGPILPNLVCIMAPPGWVSCLLDMRNSQDPLSKLDSIGISTEYFHDDHAFNYDLLDAALFRVAKFSGRRITLTLRFTYKHGVPEWFSNHVAFGKEHSVLNRLDCVWTLVISTAFFVDITQIPESDLLTWFNLFPCVKHIKFAETVEKHRVLLEKPEFLKGVAERCPNLKSVQIREVIDLDKFRNGGAANRIGRKQLETP